MSARNETFLNAALIMVGVSALATSSIAAYRTFRAPRAVVPPAAVELKDWQHYAASGNRIGSKNATVTIVEFSDFQCPYCKRAAGVLRAAQRKYPEQVAFVYRHFPLERIHPYARGAAVASECAGKQGRFENYHDLLFAEDSLSPKRWTILAKKAGVPSVSQFEKCLKDTVIESIVDNDVEAATKVGAPGTPTILINQFELMGPAVPGVIDSLIQVALRRH